MDYIYGFIHFVFIAFLSRGLPKYFETKMLVTHFHLIYNFFKKQKEVWN